MTFKQPSTMASVGRGVLAGLVGTVVMTAFQKFAEMPITGRGDSDAPAQFAETVLPIQVEGNDEHHRLNYVTHYALGTMWGSAYGIAARAGLRGRKAVATVFGIVYTGDVLLNTALGLYQPWKWSLQDVTVDVLDKFVQAAATGVIFDHVLDPKHSS